MGQIDVGKIRRQQTFSMSTYIGIVLGMFGISIMHSDLLKVGKPVPEKKFFMPGMFSIGTLYGGFSQSMEHMIVAHISLECRSSCARLAF